jgi:hypothetical protein
VLLFYGNTVDNLTTRLDEGMLNLDPFIKIQQVSSHPLERIVALNLRFGLQAKIVKSRRRD